MAKIDYRKYIEAHTLRCEAGGRGGGIEIDLHDLFPYLDEPKMTAYQNYLGGGMLGCICNSFNSELEGLHARDKSKLRAIIDATNRYYHALTNHDYDKWECASYEENQLRPASAY